jgi:allantoin racemase
VPAVTTTSANGSGRCPLRIAVISPVVKTGTYDLEAQFAPLRGDTLDIRNFLIAEGPRAVEDETDVVACLPGVLAVGRDLAQEGYDAIVINCMCDPALDELRDTVTLPVFGPAQTSMHVAAALGARFSLLDVASGGRELVETQVERYGVRSSYVSHRFIDVPVLELLQDPLRTVNALEVQALAAVDEGADAVLLGCTGLAELVHRLREKLSTHAGSPRVIEPLRTTLAVARTLLETGAFQAERCHLMKNGAGVAC